MQNPTEATVSFILSEYGIRQPYKISRIGSGYIHFTYKVVSGDNTFVLQRVNKEVFRNPAIIAANIEQASKYLQHHYPDFLFLTPVTNSIGETMTWDAEKYPWRLFPFIAGSYTVDKVTTVNEAFQAATAFGELSRRLDGVDVNKFKPTIERFHDLAWRYEQFQTALANTTSERRQRAANEIENAISFSKLVDQYKDLIGEQRLKLRVTHNDTKINNVLFDERTRQTLCAIDLDTLMPGYFIYDLGDMIRTFVSPVDENEPDISKVKVREDIYDALVNGYLNEMREVLSPDELTLVHFSGQMMTYIMALRFLADFLNGNIYYQVSYPEHNLIRTRNQLALLGILNGVN